MGMITFPLGQKILPRRFRLLHGRPFPRLPRSRPPPPRRYQYHRHILRTRQPPSTSTSPLAKLCFMRFLKSWSLSLIGWFRVFLYYLYDENLLRSLSFDHSTCNVFQTEPGSSSLRIRGLDLR